MNAVPYVLAFGLAAVLVVRTEVSWPAAIALTLFGVYLGQSSVGGEVTDAVEWLVSGLDFSGGEG